MKTMDIDTGIYETLVVIKDDDERTYWRNTFNHKEQKMNQLLEHLYYIAKSNKVDFVDIETNGYGTAFYDFFVNTDLKDNTRGFRYRK